jgi:hypothetical protein
MRRMVLIGLAVLAAAVGAGGASAGAGVQHALVVDGRELAAFAELERERAGASVYTLRRGTGDVAAVARWLLSEGELTNASVAVRDAPGATVAAYIINPWPKKEPVSALDEVTVVIDRL